MVRAPKDEVAPDVCMETAVIQVEAIAGLASNTEDFRITETIRALAESR